MSKPLPLKEAIASYLMTVKALCPKVTEAELNYLKREFPNLDRYGRLIAEEVLKTQQTRIESFLFDNAETRYLDFIKAYPDIFSRVSLSYLASYLGIERQILTRIRQKLARRVC